MAKFRKKPVVIEAFQLMAPNANVFEQEPAPVWFTQAMFAGKLNLYSDGHAEVLTLEGSMRGEVGDWIIRGVKGELYPCKSDIFAATYEAAD